MMVRLCAMFCVFTFLLVSGVGAAVAQSAPLAFGLAEDRVKITSGFNGSHITVFGHRAGRGDVIVTLSGPGRDTIVRRKDRVLGAWVNRASLEFDDIPTYYDYAGTVDNEEAVLDIGVLEDKGIGTAQLEAEPKNKKYKKPVIEAFQRALVANKRDKGLYPKKAGGVKFVQGGLFRADFYMPSNVPSGQYTVRAFLIQDRVIVDEGLLTLSVGLEGFHSGVYSFAKNRGFVYGVLCVMTALMMGWLSSVVVRRN